MTSEEVTVAQALEDVRSRISAAAERSGRSPDEVALLAVTKTISPERIQEAMAAGQTLFGENRVQEARAKIEKLGSAVTWHMIGHLQKNKAQAAAARFDAVQSVDSVELAAALDRRAGEEGRRLEVFIQVKDAEEETKSGIPPEEAPSLIEAIAGLPNLVLRGLMSIPPWPEDPEDSRPYFARLRRLREEWDGSCCPPGTLRDLSMGMTADYEVAVQEGATIVRVGSAIFGSRSYR
jgi:pyridoxal phosphate enzyme (YggS family)